MKEKFDIMEIINSNKNIVITGHKNPDGDAIGACMAMAIALKQLGKNPVVILEDFSEKYKIIPGNEFLIKDNLNEVKCDVFICLDCGSIDRITKGTEIFFKEAIITINIDHHISNNSFAKHNHVVPGASSTSELIFNIFDNIINIDKSFATAIYAGIIYDSGGLRFSTTTARTLEIVSELMKTGINCPEIYNDMVSKNTIGSVYALKRAIENLLIFNDLNLSMSSLTKNEMKELNVTKDDLDKIVQFILNIEGINISVFVYEVENDMFKISLRSKEFNVNDIAMKYGGGGHKNAAGCAIRGSKQNIFEMIKSDIISELKN